ncbi:MAG: winged helix-turn-helix domain-containing protein [Woeseia sp.]
MSADLRKAFRLGPFEVDPLRGAVTGPDGEVRHLEPKVMDVFVCLAEHAHELVTREKLLDAVWSGQVAADESLSKAIGKLRQALQDNRGDPKYIETIPKRGYRLVSVIRPIHGAKTEPSDEDARPAIGVFRSTWAYIGLSIVALGVVAIGIIAGSLWEISDTQQPQSDADWMQTVDPASIAVLPFVNVSDDPEQGYFSDGLSESLMNLLTQVAGLKVAARTSSFHFKGKTGDAAEIGKALRVAHLLEGSVRRAGDTVRVTAQLIRASDGYHLWSDEFDRDFEDIFAIQDEIAAEVVNELKDKLLDTSTPPAASSLSTGNVAALDVYYQGERQLDVGNRESILQAERLFKDALDLDEDFNLARQGILRAFLAMTGRGMITFPEWRERTEAVANEILEREPGSARALASLAFTDWSRHIPTGSGQAERLFIRALENSPRDPEILANYAHVLTYNDRPEEALAALEQALQVDPLSPRLLEAAARHGRFVHAETLRRVFPENPAGWARAAEVMLVQNRLAEAYRYFQIAEEKDPKTADYAVFSAMILASVGLLDEAQSSLESAETKGPASPIVIEGNIALMGRRGHLNQATEAVLTALRNGVQPSLLTPSVMFSMGHNMALQTDRAGEFIEAISIWSRHYGSSVLDMDNASVDNLIEFIQKVPHAPAYRAAGNDSFATELLRNGQAFFDASSTFHQYAWGFQMSVFAGDYENAMDILDTILDPGRDESLLRLRANLMDVPFPWSWWMVYEGEIAAPLRDNPRYQVILDRKNAVFAIERETIQNMINHANGAIAH